MSATTRGIYRKYKIERTDGSSGAGGKHEHCAYFVLDLEHDPFAIPALEAYARACLKDHPQLARDIWTIIRTSWAERDGRGHDGASGAAVGFGGETVSVQDESVVAGRHIDGTIGDHVRRCEALILEEQERTNPNNALIACLCDAVRLAREYCDSADWPIEDEPPSDSEET